MLSEGDGVEVGPGAAVLANYAGHVWGSDTQFDSSYERGAPSLFSLNSVVDGWATGIPEATVGSRLLISIPPELGYGEQGNAGAGIGGTDTIVFVVDVVDTFNASDAGQADATPLEVPDLPVVVEGELGSAATVSVAADAEEPAEPAVYRLADGSGDPVAMGQSVAVAFSVVYWDGSSLETSWSPAYGESADSEGVVSPTSGPLVAVLGQGTIFDLLDGVPVGSRVVLVAPSSESGPAIAVVADVLGAA
ncbi:FKBP-type peptidyl-prolyl cis-trans isomerase [Pseudactinotalea suaedae]|uniref:FKBP-type peptidyl-prolyl cis-trans isomerase n=1 Tax=Pseudactinotalea suaedae TaxID=1524924 RepID=UPI001391BCEB|nr:FKBP-type peptidyl-prolyl cis-trans isomerase [Pseudactinotalea suaedae]